MLDSVVCVERRFGSYHGWQGVRRVDAMTSTDHVHSENARNDSCYQKQERGPPDDGKWFHDAPLPPSWSYFYECPDSTSIPRVGMHFDNVLLYAHSPSKPRIVGWAF